VVVGAANYFNSGVAVVGWYNTQSGVAHAIVVHVTALSGTQYRLAAGDYTATIASVGSSLRELTWRGRHLIVPFSPDEVRPVFRGAMLAPWPNRIVNGTYVFNGSQHELALTEPARGHALHGLVTWLHFEPVVQTKSSLSLAATVQPQSGYPFRLEVEVGFDVSELGLAITLAATNTGPDPAPYGASIHPYLVPGPGRVDDWYLEMPADSVLTVTPDRLIPQEVVSVTELDGRFDFRRRRQIGKTLIDHAFTGLQAGPDESFSARLTGADGAGVEMFWTAECPWVQVHTADRPDTETNRIGLALEPMTCPPDAFNAGTNLIILESGGSNTTSWRLARL
jgi:aldose 1-epimerase